MQRHRLRHNPDPQRFDCMDCGQNTRNKTDYYMLKHGVWRIIAASRKGMLCLACASKRLGRGIVKEDLLHCPLNFSHPIFGPLLVKERLEYFSSVEAPVRSMSHIPDRTLSI